MNHKAAKLNVRIGVFKDVEKGGIETMQEAVNPRRRAEKAEMERLGIKTKKAYRKWEKKERRKLREQENAK